MIWSASADYWTVGPEARLFNYGSARAHFFARGQEKLSAAASRRGLMGFSDR